MFDFLLAARGVRAQKFTTLMMDTSPRPQPAARILAAEMSATYLPLPYANAATLSRAVLAATNPGDPESSTAA